MSLQIDSKSWGSIIIIVVILVLAAMLYFVRPNPSPIETETPVDGPTKEPVNPVIVTDGPVTILAPTKPTRPGDMVTDTTVTEPPPPTDIVTATDIPEQLQASDVQFWFGGTSEDIDFMQGIIDAYNDQNQDFNIVLTGIDFDEIDAKLTSAAALPDIATVSLSAMVELKQDLFEITTIAPNGFVVDAFQSGNIEGAQLGIPMRRFGCSLIYQFLSIPTTSKHQEQALLFIDFLTQDEQQNLAFKQQEWIPTLRSFFEPAETLSSKCPISERIPQTIDEIEKSIQVVQNAIDNQLVESVLEGRQLNPYNAVTVIEDGVVMGTFSALLTTPTEAESDELLKGDGLILGAVFIEAAPEYDPGNYVLKCWNDEKVTVQQQEANTTSPTLYEVVNTKALRLRAQANDNSSTKAFLATGARVYRGWGSQSDPQNGWIPVLYFGDQQGLDVKEGWAYQKYLKAIPPEDVPGTADHIPSRCQFISEQLSFEVIPEISQELSVSVEKPVVIVEKGSKRVCKYIFRRRVCIRIG